MAAINGTSLTLYIPQTVGATTSWVAVGLSKSASLSISADTPDISTKDSSAWTEVMAYFTARTTIKVAFGKDGGYWYGDAIISSLEESAEAEQPVSFSGSLTGTGALTYDSGNVTYP